MNEAEYLMKNYGDLGGCYLPQPTASTDNIILHNSSYDTKGELQKSWRRYKSHRSSPGDPVMKVQKQSNPPIQGLKLQRNKVEKPRTMPTYVCLGLPPWDGH